MQAPDKGQRVKFETTYKVMFADVWLAGDQHGAPYRSTAGFVITYGTPTA